MPSNKSSGRQISCGPVHLGLAGVPADSPNNLILCLINQLHHETKQFLYPPSTMIPLMITSLKEFIESSKTYNSTVGADLQAICDCFTISVIVYYENDRVVYQPSTHPYLTAQLYFKQGRFDSVVSVVPKNISQDPLQKFDDILVRMASWNLRGVTDVIKREMTDRELSRQKITLAGLQETHLRCQSLNTTNYNWILGPQSLNQMRASRGIGYIIHQSFRPYVTEITFPSVNIGVLKFKLPLMKDPFFFINVHKCSEGDPSSGLETGLLSSIIQSSLKKGEVIISGDLNCHFGKNDENIRDSEFIGNNLLHLETNGNGDELFLMCELLKLRVATTMGSPSTKVTWTNNKSSTQIDHVLVPKSSLYSLIKLRAAWSKVPTDHKLLTWSVIIPLNAQQKKPSCLPNFSLYYSKTWDLSILSVDSIKEKYDKMFKECLDKIPADEVNWGKISSIACFCAENLLKRKRYAMTEDHRVAYLNYRQALDKVMKPRIVDANPDLVDPLQDYPPITHPGSIKILREAHNALYRAKCDKSRHALDRFLEHLQNNIPLSGQKVQMAFDYLRITKRSAIHKCASSVSVKHWDDEQRKLAGPLIPLLEENDFHPFLPPPSYSEMLSIIAKMKNNKTPGLDNVGVELFKSSETLCYQLYKLIRTAYLTNILPIEWQNTYSVPIPKIKNPKTTHDFRKLTMCTYAYKIYTSLLMDKLKVFLPDMPYYQSGFQPNRSCDDLCFVMRNILEYRWGRGERTYLISMDLKKAFDAVKISQLPN